MSSCTFGITARKSKSEMDWLAQDMRPASNEVKVWGRPANTTANILRQLRDWKGSDRYQEWKLWGSRFYFEHDTGRICSETWELRGYSRGHQIQSHKKPITYVLISLVQENILQATEREYCTPTSIKFLTTIWLACKMCWDNSGVELVGVANQCLVYLEAHTIRGILCPVLPG